VELVGDELHVGKELFGEALVGVAQVEGNEAHVFASSNMSDWVLGINTATAISHL